MSCNDNWLEKSKYLIFGLDRTSYTQYNYYSYGYSNTWVSNQLFIKYIQSINKFGYYSSIYTDFFQSNEVFGLTLGTIYRLNKLINIYSGAGFEFIDEEGQLEFGVILDLKKIPLDIGYRYNFDWSEYSGFRIGTGFKF